eukprot:TRINITY_DN14479_c0_g1_i2.p1 TRINITY_DN14479_c0_g1~~TRINITY_DN14479_c0_g1_i2.p1  ORF type:complete len:954 (-),score=186.04 TRINITY_DN14479_c0_g1_i2:81-2942(-)
MVSFPFAVRSTAESSSGGSSNASSSAAVSAAQLLVSLARLSRPSGPAGPAAPAVLRPLGPTLALLEKGVCGSKSPCTGTTLEALTRVVDFLQRAVSPDRCLELALSVHGCRELTRQFIGDVGCLLAELGKFGGSSSKSSASLKAALSQWSVCADAFVAWCNEVSELYIYFVFLDVKGDSGLLLQTARAMCSILECSEEHMERCLGHTRQFAHRTLQALSQRGHLTLLKQRHSNALRRWCQEWRLHMHSAMKREHAGHFPRFWSSYFNELFLITWVDFARTLERALGLGPVPADFLELLKRQVDPDDSLIVKRATWLELAGDDESGTLELVVGLLERAASEAATDTAIFLSEEASEALPPMRPLDTFDPEPRRCGEPGADHSLSASKSAPGATAPAAASSSPAAAAAASAKSSSGADRRETAAAAVEAQQRGVPEAATAAAAASGKSAQASSSSAKAAASRAAASAASAPSAAAEETPQAALARERREAATAPTPVDNSMPHRAPRAGPLLSMPEYVEKYFGRSGAWWDPAVCDPEDERWLTAARRVVASCSREANAGKHCSSRALVLRFLSGELAGSYPVLQVPAAASTQELAPRPSLMLLASGGRFGFTTFGRRPASNATADKNVALDYAMPEPIVSRSHFNIYFDAASRQYRLMDAGSKWGTFVSVKRPHLLSCGDWIRIGNTEFVVRYCGGSSECRKEHAHYRRHSHAAIRGARMTRSTGSAVAALHVAGAGAVGGEAAAGGSDTEDEEQSRASSDAEGAEDELPANPGALVKGWTPAAARLSRGVEVNEEAGVVAASAATSAADDEFVPLAMVPVPPLELIFVSGPLMGERRIIQERQATVGRSESCTVQVTGPPVYNVSRVHCVLEYLGGSWRVRDNGSTNGTWMRLSCVLSPSKSLPLATGLTFLAGVHEIQVQEVDLDAAGISLPLGCRSAVPRVLRQLQNQELAE